MRIVLEAYFNRRTITKCDVNVCQPCYLCLRKHQITTETVARSCATQLRNQEAFIALEDQLSRLQNLCYPCLLNRIENASGADYHHFLYACPLARRGGFVEQVRQLERTLKQGRLFKAGSCCFQCFLPPRFCYNRDIRHERCQFQSTVLETIVFMHHISQRQPDLMPLDDDSQTFRECLALAAVAREIASPIVYQGGDAIKAIPIILQLDLRALAMRLVGRTGAGRGTDGQAAGPAGGSQGQSGGVADPP